MITFKSYFIKGSASIADLFKEKDRCGIYVLNFSNGEHYVGKTTDIVRRYSQHRHTYSDIEILQFCNISKHKISSVEMDMITTIEKMGYKIRNIAGTETPYEGDARGSYRAIDLIIKPEEQESWRSGNTLEDNNIERRNDPFQRDEYDEKMRRLEKEKYYHSFIEALRSYFEVGIPCPRTTEYSMYSVSCLPKTNVYSRININGQEVFTAYEDGGDLRISLHVAKKYIEGVLPLLKKKYEGLSIEDHRWKPGGIDQINLDVICDTSFEAFLHEPQIFEAIRTMNMRLMQRGANMFSRYHCPQIVDKILES